MAIARPAQPAAPTSETTKCTVLRLMRSVIFDLNVPMRNIVAMQNAAETHQNSVP